VRNKLDEHELPDDAADAIPADLDTAGWSWDELAEYQSAWLDSYRETVTELCRNLIHEHTRSR
jgi:glutamyl/glutaminyl-tRNA synthetase